MALAPDTASYDPTAITTSKRDEARFLIQDTGPEQWSFTNAEVDGAISLCGSACRAAVLLARRKAAELASGEATSLSIGDLSVVTTGGSEHWKSLADSIEEWCSRRAAMSGIGIGPGGVSYQHLPHLFRIGQHDHPGARVAFTPEPVVFDEQTISSDGL